MPTHRFEIGSAVTLTAEWPRSSDACRYVVEAQMPPVGTLMQYRIKGETESYRRVVVEYKLAPFSLSAVTMPVAGTALERASRPHPGEEN